MLRLLSSQTPSFGGLRERECPRCHRAVDLPLGDLCRECRIEIHRRATWIARWVSLVTTLGFGVYVLLRLPPDRTARMVAGLMVLMWYVISRQIAVRVARTWLQR